MSAPRRVLLVEDEAVFARAVEKRLAKAGLACQVAGTLADARRLLMGPEPDAILLDMRLPDGSGLDLLSEVRERRGSAVPVLVLTAYGEVEDAVLAMKLRASDYLKKPIDLEELLVSIDKVFAQSELQRALEHSRQRERQGLEGLRFLGEHPSIVELRGQAERLGSLCAGAAGPPPAVLILGETGTGKDLMAKLLHHSGPRRNRPFVHVDCAALPKDLIEGELFGHEKGAYTSAVGARSGLIEAAEDGVVFLDEVAELPIELQAKLLAVLERRTVRRLGSTRERPVSAWIIAATNRDPEAMVASGALRADLYFRLNVLAIRMPPLCERGADIVLLARDFAEQLARRYGLPAPSLTPEACAALMAYSWPGNVRELKHLMERVVLLSGGADIDARALMLPPAPESPSPEDGPAGEGDGLLGLSLEGAERLLIEQALAATGYNVSEAARQLGVTRMAMRYRMRKHGLDNTSHQVRSDLFRQIREVTRARLMEDPAALELYRDYSRRIDQHFNGLRRHTASRPESLAVQDMQRAYRIIQHDMNNIFTDPYVVNRVVRLKILESGYEQRMVGDFEAAFAALARLTAEQHAILERTMHRWTRLSPVLLPIPIVFAAGLVLLSRRALRRGFVQPMAEVIAGARLLSAGHLEHRLSAGGAHEMAELAETLNQMAADLAESRDAALRSERQAALGALVPVIAHNIRNPLASIRAAAQLLAHAERPADVAEVQEAVIETVDRLGRWVTALVSYLHPLRPHRVATEPWAIVQAAVVLLAPRLQEKGIRVDERRCPEEPRVPMDVDLMEQALAGLLANAIEASPPADA